MRRLCQNDDVGKLKDWISAMTTINRLLKEGEIKEYRDGWRPQHQGQKNEPRPKMEIAQVEPTKRRKKTEAAPTVSY